MTDIALQLKDSDYREELDGLDYTGESVYLDILNSTYSKNGEEHESSAIGHFRIVDDGITVSNKDGENSIQKDISLEDHKEVVISKYQGQSSLEKRLYKFKDHNGREFKVGYDMRVLSFPTINDHGRVISQIVPAFRIRNMLNIQKSLIKGAGEHILVMDENMIKAHESDPDSKKIAARKISNIIALKKLIFKSLIAPEFNQILKSINSGESNYKNIDKFSGAFIQFHSLNLVKENKEDELTIVQRIAKGEIKTLTNSIESALTS